MHTVSTLALQLSICSSRNGGILSQGGRPTGEGAVDDPRPDGMCATFWCQEVAYNWHKAVQDWQLEHITAAI
jgi:hypothetical protein